MSKWKIFRFDPYVASCEIHQLQIKWIIVDVFHHDREVCIGSGVMEKTVYIVARSKDDQQTDEP